MKENPVKDLYVFKRTTFIGNCLGFAILLFSFTVSDYNENFLLTFIGMGIIIASMTTFVFGMCLNLMDETAEKSKGVNTSPSDEDLYYFLEKPRYFH